MLNWIGIIKLRLIIITHTSKNRYEPVTNHPSLGFILRSVFLISVMLNWIGTIKLRLIIITHTSKNRYKPITNHPSLLQVQMDARNDEVQQLQEKNDEINRLWRELEILRGEVWLLCCSYISTGLGSSSSIIWLCVELQNLLICVKLWILWSITTGGYQGSRPLMEL